MSDNLYEQQRYARIVSIGDGDNIDGWNDATAEVADLRAELERVKAQRLTLRREAYEARATIRQLECLSWTARAERAESELKYMTAQRDEWRELWRDLIGRAEQVQAQRDTFRYALRGALIRIDNHRETAAILREALEESYGRLGEVQHEICMGKYDASALPAIVAAIKKCERALTKQEDIS